MHKMIRYFMAFISVVLVMSFFPQYSYARNDFRTVIEDNEDLISAEEEILLEAKMEEITQFGNAAFITVEQYSYETGTYAKNEYRRLFGTESGIVFVIDMGKRNIWIFSDGAIYRTITKPYANTITDNVYRYASRGEYFSCAYEAFDEVVTLLKGGRISQPMKYISNVLISMVLAVLINFILLVIERKEKKAEPVSALKAMTSAVGVTAVAKQLTRTKRSLHVESSGGGGGSSGGGGGGGGGSSGGGGGHSF